MHRNSILHRVSTSRNCAPVATALLLAILVPSMENPTLFTKVEGGLQTGCAKDFKKFCNPQSPNATVQAGCLRQYWMNLSPNCQKILKAQQSGDDDASNSDE